MAQNNFENKVPKTISIEYCNCCGNFEFIYRFFRCHLKLDSLIDILRGIYEYEANIKNEIKYHPFKFKLGGIASITILYTDYNVFKEELEHAIISEENLSKNITALLEKYDLTIQTEKD